MKKAVLISCFDWYHARLSPIEDELKKKGYSVMVLTSDFDHLNKCKITDKVLPCEYLSVPPYKKNLSVKRFLSHKKFASLVKEKIYSIIPNLIYVLLPPNSVGYECAKYKKDYPHSKLIVDIIDLWPESTPLPWIEKTFPYKYWKGLRTDALNAADYIITECDYYQEILMNDISDKNVRTLYLYKRINISSNENFKKELIKYYKPTFDKNRLKLCYLGSINYIIDLCAIEEISCALAKNGIEVECHIVGDGSSRDNLIDVLEKNGCNVFYYGKVFNEEEKKRIFMQCDLALNLMKDDVKVGLTIKSIDYLSYGLPIINNIKGDTKRFVEEYNIGFNYGKNSDSFIQYIAESDFLELHKNAYKCYMDKFSRIGFVERLKKILESIV